MADLMDMRWLVRDINQRAVDEVRIQHIFTPGLPDEIRREKIRRRKFAQAENHIPFYFLLDITYIWASFLSVVVSLVYFAMFATLLGWTPSIQAFAIKNIGKGAAGSSSSNSSPVNEDVYVSNMLEEYGYNMRIWAGYYLFMGIMLFGISWYSYFGAGVVGRRIIYVISLANHFGVLLVEIYSVIFSFSYLPTTCDTTDFRKHMFDYFIWYGILTPHLFNHGHEAMVKMDSVQGALACCGIDSYKDYEKIFATEGDPAFNASWYPDKIFQLESYTKLDVPFYQKNGREIRQLPPSCCNPFWRQNVYCAEDIFTIERTVPNNTFAKDRINPRGCIEAVGETCNRFIYLMTYGMLGVLTFRIIICFMKLIITGFTLRSMNLIMTTLFSVTRGNTRFIYDYRKTRPEEDPYKKAIGDFRRGVVPEGWEEFIENRIEGRKKAFPISEQFTVGQLKDNSALEDKLYKHIIEKWKGDQARAEGKEIYFGVEPPPDVKEADFLAQRGQDKELRTDMFTRLAKIGVDSRRLRKDRTLKRAAKLPKKLTQEKLGKNYGLSEVEKSKKPRQSVSRKKPFDEGVHPYVPIPSAPPKVAEKPPKPTEKQIQERPKEQAQGEPKKEGKWKAKFKKAVESLISVRSERKHRAKKNLPKERWKAGKDMVFKKKGDAATLQAKERQVRKSEKPAAVTRSLPELPEPVVLPRLPPEIVLPGENVKHERKVRHARAERKVVEGEPEVRREKPKAVQKEPKHRREEPKEGRRSQKAPLVYDEEDEPKDEPRKLVRSQPSKFVTAKVDARLIRPQLEGARPKREKVSVKPEKRTERVMGSRVDDRLIDVIKPKLEDVQLKLGKPEKKPDEKKVKKVVPKRPKVEPKEYRPYEAEIATGERAKIRKARREKVREDDEVASNQERARKLRRKRRTRPAEPPTVKPATLPILTSKAKKKKIKRERKPVEISERKPWNYGAHGSRSTTPTNYVT